MSKLTHSHARLLVYKDENTVVVISRSKRHVIKGSGMSSAIKELIECFEVPNDIDSAIHALAGKYSRASISKLITHLMDLNILKEVQDAETKLDGVVLFKTHYYTLHGKTMQEIQAALAPISIGLVGLSQFVRLLYVNLVDSSLLSKFHVGITDGLNDNIGCTDKTGAAIITEYQITEKMDGLSSLISGSDIVIASANYHDHFLFDAVNKMCLETGKKWLRIVMDGSVSEIGPLFIPGETGCYTCLKSRRKSNLQEEHFFDDLLANQQVHFDARRNYLSFSYFYPMITITAGIASAELMKYLVGMNDSLLNHVLTIDGMSFQTQKDYTIKDYSCSSCADRTVTQDD